MQDSGKRYQNSQLTNSPKENMGTVEEETEIALFSNIQEFNPGIAQKLPSVIRLLRYPTLTPGDWWPTITWAGQQSPFHSFSFFLISAITSKIRFLAFVLCLGTNSTPAFGNVSLHFIHCSSTLMRYFYFCLLVAFPAIQTDVLGFLPTD